MCSALNCSVTSNSFCNPMDCSLLGSSVQKIFQVRILRWVAISSSRGSSWPRDQTLHRLHCQVEKIYHWATWEATVIEMTLIQKGHLSLNVFSLFYQPCECAQIRIIAFYQPYHVLIWKKWLEYLQNKH